MSYLDDQKTRMLAGAADVRGIYTNTFKQKIISGFHDNPAYYLVQVTTTSLTTSNVDSQIVDDPTKTKEVKQIQLIPDIQLNYGDLILWLGDYWLTTTVDRMGELYYRGSIEKCFSSLKWQDSTGAIKEAYFTLSKDTQTGLGIEEGKIMVLPNERRYIALQNNADTIKIKKKQRFIFDEDRTWKVTSINSLKTGIIELELEETADLNDVTDNVALRVANYSVPPVVTSPVGLYISSASTPINQIKVTQSKVFQSFINNTLTPVNWEIHDASKTLTTTLVTIQSSTSTSCTLIANSNFQYGSVQLKATLQSDATQFYCLQIDVKSIS